ncbi:MAG TPA: hypothetical protein VG322_06970, partial [Candidatus Acidoferrales bacterium]|nr:hypothetical protein [Candidatus Acidoferrales bacterium]
FSNLDAAVRYIHSQEAHHRKISFEDEFREILKMHRVEYDPEYLFGVHTRSPENCHAIGTERIPTLCQRIVPPRRGSLFPNHGIPQLALWATVVRPSGASRITPHNR